MEAARAGRGRSSTSHCLTHRRCRWSRRRLETYEHQHPVHVAGTDINLHQPIRSDMVYFEAPNGDAVFSVGSIAYCGALSRNGYDNNVSRITENVLRRFAASR